MLPALFIGRRKREALTASAGSGRLEGALLLSILAVGLLFRLWDLSRPFIGDLSYNELVYVTIARNFERYSLFSQHNYGDSMTYLSPRLVMTSSPLVPWMVYGAMKALGTAEWVARLPMLILGMSALACLYLIARELYDGRLALGATFVAAVMPGVVFFSRTVQLDGPMTALGLASFLTLLLYERKRQPWWLVASSLLLALALLAKYTAVLFLPALAWVWLRIARRSAPRGAVGMYLSLGFYLLVAVLPAASWLAYTLLTPVSSPQQMSPSTYLNRLSEWNLRGWYAALLALWPVLSDHVGHAFWYPLVLVAALSLPTGRLVALARQHFVLVLLMAPWFAQIVYPRSWTANPYYDYPALYGVAIVLALVLRWLLGWARQAMGAAGSRWNVSMALLMIVLTFASLWDYRETFHGGYFPWNVVTRQDPLYSARVARSANVDHGTILADLPQTLYYAEEGYGRGAVVFYQYDDRNMIEAIRSGKFDYVVFTNVPTVDIVSAVSAGGYQRIAPAAWRRANGARGEAHEDGSPS